MRAVAVFIVGLAFIACSGDKDSRPPATSSGGTASSTSSSSGAPSDGGSSSTSSGGIIDTGLRAVVDGTRADFDTSPTADNQTGGTTVVISGTDKDGNDIALTLTNDGKPVDVDTYLCAAGASEKAAKLEYRNAADEVWVAATCKVVVRIFDNTAGGVISASFDGTVTKVGKPDKQITAGEFRLTMD